MIQTIALTLEANVGSLLNKVEYLDNRCEAMESRLHACPGVKFGLLYPAILRLTVRDGSTHRFEDLALAAEFIQRNIAVDPK